MSFLDQWREAATTSVGLFWMAFWAFGLGYIVSSMIQVFVTKDKMKESMGGEGIKSISLGTFFGFISSSCSFAALSTTRSLFAKGASFVASLAFMLASTNLVIELGIVISVFLTWQFVVAEYVGGVLLILITWLIISITKKKELIDQARDNADKSDDEDNNSSKNKSTKELIQDSDSWSKVASNYIMEWSMVWKDVTIGFTVAGIISVFVSTSFFETLFVNLGSSDLSLLDVLLHSLIGPIAAFFTFIGSMGNIPLAAVLFKNGVSFAGVIAFIFSDLVVYPVWRIQKKYYGTKPALYIMTILLFAVVISSVTLHFGFDFLGYLPDSSSLGNIAEQEFFKINYGFYLNCFFIGLTLFIIYIERERVFSKLPKISMSTIVALGCYIWLLLGLAI